MGASLTKARLRIPEYRSAAALSGMVSTLRTVYVICLVYLYMMNCVHSTVFNARLLNAYHHSRDNFFLLS